MVKSTRFRSIGVAAAAFVAVGALSLAGCSATPTDPAGTPDAAESPTAGGCGSVPEIGVTDPGGLLSTLSADVQSGYNAYPYEIKESAWSDWKSQKTDGFTAAIVGRRRPPRSSRPTRAHSPTRSRQPGSMLC